MPRRKDKSSDLDPNQIKEAHSLYVYGELTADDGVVYPTLGEVAKKVGLTENQVRHLSAAAGDGGWKAERARVMERAMAVETQLKAQEMAAAITAFDSDALRAAQLGVMLVTANLEAMAGDVQHQLEAGEGNGDGHNGSVRMPSPNQLRTLGEALGHYQDAGRKALGVIEGMAIDIRTSTAPADGSEIGAGEEIIDVPSELSQRTPRQLAELVEHLNDIAGRAGPDRAIETTTSADS